MPSVCLVVTALLELKGTVLTAILIGLEDFNTVGGYRVIR